MLRVTPSTYRRVKGYRVSGSDTLGRSIRIFTVHEGTARAVVDAIKRNDRDEVSRLLREEPRP